MGGLPLFQVRLAGELEDAQLQLARAQVEAEHKVAQDVATLRNSLRQQTERAASAASQAAGLKKAIQVRSKNLQSTALSHLLRVRQLWVSKQDSARMCIFRRSLRVKAGFSRFSPAICYATPPVRVI